MRNKGNVDKIVVEKIIGYCNDIEGFMDKFNNSFDSYLSVKDFRYSCDMCTLQIGELTTRFSGNFKETHSEIEWRKIKALRNIYVHEYESIDFEEIWKILTQDIPELKKILIEILATMKEEN